MIPQKVKSAIENFEYYKNGFARLSGCWAKAVNVRRVHRGWKADVILTVDCGEQQERYNGCFYPDGIIDQYKNVLERYK